MQDELMQKLVRVLTDHYREQQQREETQREVDLKNLLINWPFLRSQVDTLRNDIAEIKNRLTQLER